MSTGVKPLRSNYTYRDLIAILLASNSEINVKVKFI